VGDQPGICPLSVKRSLVTVDLKKSIYRFRANPEGENRAASCRPPSVLAPGSALGSCRHGALSSVQAKSQDRIPRGGKQGIMVRCGD
jgi:hypothetical protein